MKKNSRSKATRGLKPMHPGELLREVILPAVDLPKTEIARLLGISRQTLYSILNEKLAVSPEMAVRLAKMFGNSPQFWVNLQTGYDLARAEKTVDVSKIPTLRAA